MIQRTGPQLQLPIVKTLLKTIALLLFLSVHSSSSASKAESQPLKQDQEQQEEQHQQQQQGCVTLLEYKHRDCGGSPISVRNNTVWTKPGSPCKHTSRMGSNSVKDQYCDEGGTFHQTVFVKDKHCKVKWYEKAYSPIHLTYSKGECTYGYSIAACITTGPCEHPSPPVLDAEEDDYFFQMN